MLQIAVLRVEKVLLGLAFTTVNLAAGITALVVTVLFLDHIELHPNTNYMSLYLLLFTLVAVGGFFTSAMTFSNKFENVLLRLRDREMEVKLRLVPNLYTCYNNGVTVVVRKKDYQSSPYDGVPVIVPNALTFSDTSNPRVREVVTGTMEDLRRLTDGASITNLYGSEIYVPYTSGMMKPEDEARLFPHITLEQAEQYIWAGYKRPKSKRRAA